MELQHYTLAAQVQNNQSYKWKCLAAGLDESFRQTNRKLHAAHFRARCAMWTGTTL